MVRAAFVADDFTGATDALWQFQRFGLRSRLYTGLPDLSALPDDLDVIGVATTARSADGRGSADIAVPLLRDLAALDPVVLQYKVCSTFDSAPTRGSIGAVIDAFRSQESTAPPVPVLPAQPEFGRWTFFANHFARYAGAGFRLDRHEPMRNHPSTPVDEADLRRHLGRQLSGGAESVGELNVPVLDDDALEHQFDACFAEDTAAFVVDAVSERDLVCFGRVLQSRLAARPGPSLTVGSGGLSFACASAMTSGSRAADPVATPPAPTGPVLALSGSASPVTERQIREAEAAGWASVPLLGADPWPRVSEALSAGRHTVVWSARGRADDEPQGIGARLGDIAMRAVADRLAGRLLIAGGDTSGDVVGLADVEALEIVSSIDVAGLLCRAIGAGSPLDGYEVVLKGGQVGGPDFFLVVAGEGAR